MTCVNPRNQMIYQMLLNKAASYPADQTYKATAYKYAAESVRTWPADLRNNSEVMAVPNVGRNIGMFIMDFNDHPCSISFCSTCEKASKPITQEPYNHLKPKDLVEEKIQQLKDELTETTDESNRELLLKRILGIEQRQAQRAQRREEREKEVKVDEPILGSITYGEIRRSSRLQTKPKVQYRHS